MKLDKVNIRNFRSIKEADIDFSENPRVLVGINESGKTNILHALRLLSDDFSIQKSDVREPSSDSEQINEAYVLFIFKFDREDKERLYENIKDKILITKEESIKLAEFNRNQYTLHELCQAIDEGVYKVDLKANKRIVYCEFGGLKLIPEFKKPKVGVNHPFQDKNGDVKNISQFKLIHYKSYKDVIPSEYIEEAETEDLKELIDEVIREIIGDNLPEVIFWEYKDDYLLPPKIPIDSFQTNPNMCKPLKNLFLLKIPEEKIPEYIGEARKNFNTFRSRLNRIANTATKLFNKSWPEYKTIKFSLYPTETNICCGVEEKNIWNFQQRSDGFKRFISILLLLTIPAKEQLLNNALILIDEADVSLHPSGARYLMEQLKKIAQNNYVIYSTHSIFMIDRENIERHYIVKKENEITKIQEASEESYRDEEVLFKALGSSVYEVLNEKNILFEGWRDKKLFDIFISKSKDNENFFKNIGISHAIGVKSIKNILPILEMGNRKCLIITDGDSEAKEKQREWRKHKGFGVWKRYDEIFEKRSICTAEDFIKKEVLLNALQQILKKENINFKKGEFNLPDDKRLPYIVSELRKRNVENRKINEIVKKLKEEVFHNLKYSDIEEDYNYFIESIKKEIENL